MNESITESPYVFFVPKILSTATGVPPSPIGAPLELPELLPPPLLDPLPPELLLPELLPAPLLDPLLPELPLPEPLLAVPPLLPEAPLLPELLLAVAPLLPPVSPLLDPVAPELLPPLSFPPGGTYVPVPPLPQFILAPPTTHAIGNTIDVASSFERCMKSSAFQFSKGAYCTIAIARRT
ncbi:MAG: hypothetical protein M3O46_02180 [Myxococcota bacterium]|nr:hypothetical protein [Myxococcota bacterium]